MAPVDPRLAGPWAKVDRAKAHVDDLRAQILAPRDGPEGITLKREYEQERRAVVYRIESVPQVDEHWGLVIGDAIHNYRCALDHLWFELAVLHLQREPTDTEARSIQFPILSDKGNGARPTLSYDSCPHGQQNEWKYCKPFGEPESPNSIHPLWALAELSNIDKHRRIHAVLAVAHQGNLRIPFPEDMRDCYTEAGRIVDGQQASILIQVDRSNPKAGDEMAAVFVVPTGPNSGREFVRQRHELRSDQRNLECA